ncbi:MAG: hypothetical protein JO116_18465, partial [Planctomycetaceae bacterium]|nr:hypothetical protein [Planctomycetaceae bacterium]
GLADPQAMVQASAAAQVTQLVGLPEALYPLTQATLYLARAPKSNAVKRAYFACRGGLRRDRPRAGPAPPAQRRHPSDEGRRLRSGISLRPRRPPRHAGDALPARPPRRPRLCRAR